MVLNASILPATHPVQQMQGLAKTIALPNMFPPTRYPSFPALERTATIGFSYPTALDTEAGVPTHVMVARQAAWPLWAGQKGTAWAYSVHYTSEKQAVLAAQATGDEYDYPIRPEFTDFTTGSRVASSGFPWTLGVSGALPLPFVYPIIGRDATTGAGDWFYIPGGGACAVVIGSVEANAFSPTASTTMVLNYEIWTSPGRITHNSVTFSIPATKTAAHALLTPTLEGTWIRPKSVNYSTVSAPMTQIFVQLLSYNTTQITMTMMGAQEGLGTMIIGGTVLRTFAPLVAPSEFATSRLPWYGSRVTAVAGLFTNVSQVINKGGTILAGRSAPSYRDPWQVTYDTLKAFHPSEKAFLPYETGCYTYCPPSTDMADFWDYTLSEGLMAKNPLPVYRLDNDAMVNHMFFSAPAAVAESLAVTLDIHLEFRTSSALFNIGLSTITIEAFHQAQIALAAAGFFFENPQHKAVLSRVVQAARKTVSMASLQLPRKPMNKMKTTTATSSGYMGPRSPPRSRRQKKQKKNKTNPQQQPNRNDKLKRY